MFKTIIFNMGSADMEFVTSGTSDETRGKLCTSLQSPSNNSIAWYWLILARVAELGSLSSGAKLAMKIFVKRELTIFASNAPFLRVIANLQN